MEIFLWCCVGVFAIVAIVLIIKYYVIDKSNRWFSSSSYKNKIKNNYFFTDLVSYLLKRHGKTKIMVNFTTQHNKQKIIVPLIMFTKQKIYVFWNQIDSSCQRICLEDDLKAIACFNHRNKKSYYDLNKIIILNKKLISWIGLNDKNTNAISNIIVYENDGMNIENFSKKNFALISECNIYSHIEQELANTERNDLFDELKLKKHLKKINQENIKKHDGELPSELKTVQNKWH